METKKLNQMRGSEIHRIVAAVFEVMEKVQVEPNVETKLQLTGKTEEGQPERWKMEFLKKDSSIEELMSIRKELGSDFTIRLSAANKAILICIEAPATHFITLLQNKTVLTKQPNVLYGRQGDIQQT